MSGCNTTPSSTTAKACSGKCLGSHCGGTPRVWVAAACEGMISLFEKTPQGSVSLLTPDDDVVFSSLENFQTMLSQAEARHAFDQLVIVGSSNDIAWMHSALPPPTARHVTAEIEYPLVSGWFRQTPNLPNLAHALEHVFTG